MIAQYFAQKGMSAGRFLMIALYFAQKGMPAGRFLMIALYFAHFSFVRYYYREHP